MIYITVRGRNWPAHSADLAEMIFGNRKAKVPAEGFPPVMVQGIKVWAVPREARFRLRVMAECPVCGWIGAAGRLRQHAKRHK
jgi:hypothetical protein